jgi:microcin C transport system permease protein
MNTTSQSPSLLMKSQAPWKRVWNRFKQNRRGYWSLLIFSVLFVISLFAELVSNDKPLIASYEGQIVFPVLHDYSEKSFGGDFRFACRLSRSFY